MNKLGKTKEKVLYYPFIEINDKSWLLSSLLFWDRISTITPDMQQPYSSRISRELFDLGVLVPLRVNPQRREVAVASNRMFEYMTNPHFRSLIGKDHWSVMQSQGLYPDKIEGNLMHELEMLGKAKKRADNLIEMEGGLAAGSVKIFL